MLDGLNMRITDPVYRVHLLLLICCLLIGRVRGIQIYEVGVPSAVRAGDNVLLACHYDMQGDVLYSIKWYKGRREFYRYTLKENPAKKVFKVVGMNVDQTRSNASHVLLTSVVANNSGKYGCEASADAPSFHTQIMFKEMMVVDPPEQRPAIGGLKTRYADGELLRANCTTRNSRPAANLTWTINDRIVPPSQVYHVKPVRDAQTNLQTTTSGIHFVVSSTQHYVQGKLKLKCTARIFDVYTQSTEKVIESDSFVASQETTSSFSSSHDVLSSSSNNNNNNNNNVYSNNSVYNFNKHLFNYQSSDSLHDFESYGGMGQGNKNEAYMTPIQADMSSTGRVTSLSFCTLLLLIMFQLWASNRRSATATKTTPTVADYWHLRISRIDTM